MFDTERCALKWRRVLGWIFLTFAFFHADAAGAPAFSFRDPATFKIGRQKFDLSSAEGRDRFHAHAARLLGAEGGGNQTLSKKDRRGLREMLRLSESLLDETSEAQRAMHERHLMEIAAAVANNHRPAIPRYVGLPDLPFRFVDSLSNPVGKGKTIAANLENAESEFDLSLIDPGPSTFWKRPRAIAAANLEDGFDRTERSHFDEGIWSYAGPKTGGGNPGCELVSGSRRIKAKFAEVHSEPFASRIFHALGYHVEPIDYTPRLKVRYDRRFFAEFNRLPELKMKIGVFFIPVYTFHFERRYDPFDYIDRAVFKDGSARSGEELRSLLLLDDRAKNRFAAENFNSATEAEIDHLVTVEANVQVEDDRLKSIGPWDFGGLGHENLRELRGAGVLAGWLGWWDSRFDNTRLRIVETESGRELQHYFSDLGAGLGLSAGTYRHSSEQPQEFTWTFTRSVRRGNGWTVRFPDYEPIEDTAAFREITFDDTRWMARLIGQLTEEQITGALEASGFSEAEVAIYREKLISRRDQLVLDARLTDQIQLLGSTNAIPK